MNHTTSSGSVEKPQEMKAFPGLDALQKCVTICHVLPNVAPGNTHSREK